MEGYTNATYPGVEGIESGTISTATGLTPARISLSIHPVDPANIAIVGDFTLTYAGPPSVTFEFKDCFAKRGDFTFSNNGQLLKLVLYDHRWRWQFGFISGRYNVRNARNEIVAFEDAVLDPEDVIAFTERKPSELVQLLWDAIPHVSGAELTVQNMPDETRPFVEWEYANPAAELDRLVTSLGCEIYPSSDGRVVIDRKGYGSGPDPSLGKFVENGSLVIEEAPPPGLLTVITGPTVYQDDILLEAVGIETDGRILPLDELSYKPADGWRVANIKNFTNSAAKSLARRSVLKWYRFVVEETNDPPWKYIDQLLPVRDELLDISPTTGFPAQAFVYGVFANLTSVLSNNTILELDEIDPEVEIADVHKSLVSFGIDNKFGIVKFGTAVFKYDPNMVGQFPADLKLRATFSFKKLNTGLPVRVDFKRDINPSLPGERIIYADQIKPWVNIPANTDNEPEIIMQCNEIIDTIAEEYIDINATQVTYIGIHRLPHSGQLQSVEWRWGFSGSSTTANYNADPGSSILPSKIIRRRYEYIQNVNTPGRFS